MEVFLLPIGGERYELYCEGADDPAPTEESAVRGWRQWLIERFTSVVSSVEAARHGAADRRATRQPRTLLHRLRDRVVCWLAEKIAEQRLLWNLRWQERVIAWFPDDLDEQHAGRQVQHMLRADAERHLRWLAVDSVGFVASLALVPLPGPNLLLYYFIFRVVGHYLSRRGALHGLKRVDWSMRSTPALTDLRKAITLEPDVRERHVTAVASRLRLQHLAAFYERVAVSSP